MANWAELPSELLQLIVRRLPLDDYINFAAVCTSWRLEATKENYNPKTRQPWSMLVSRISPGCRSLKLFPFSGPYIGCHRRKLLRMQGSVRSLFSQGWTVKGRIHRNLILYNPFTRVAIKLPTLKAAFKEFRQRRHLGIVHFVISASPSLSADYIAIFCFYDPPAWTQTWAWTSKQREWIRVNVPPTSQFSQFIHYKGQFVALDSKLQIHTLDDNDVVKGTFTVQMKLNKKFFYWHSPPFLIECRGSLLLVDYTENERFRMVEVDLEAKRQRGVKSLGNTSIFLNYNLRQSFSMEVGNTDESMPSHFLERVRPNCIYSIYVNDDESVGLWEQGPWNSIDDVISEQGLWDTWMGIHHMEDGHSDWKYLGKVAPRFHAWVQPSF